MDVDAAMSKLNNILEDEETSGKLKNIIEMFGNQANQGGSSPDSAQKETNQESQPLASNQLATLLKTLGSTNLGGSGSNSTPNLGGLESLAGLAGLLGSSGLGNQGGSGGLGILGSLGGLGGLGGIANLIGTLGSLTGVGAHDPRIALLDAITPFLKNEKRERVDNCKNVLRIASLAQLLEPKT